MSAADPKVIDLTQATTSVSEWAAPTWDWVKSVFAAGQTNEHHFGSKLKGDGAELSQAVGAGASTLARYVEAVNAKLASWGIPINLGPLIGSASYVPPVNHVVFHASPWWALLGSASLSATYVGSLYIWPLLSRKFGWNVSPPDARLIDRSDPKVIVSRFVSVGIASLASLGVVRLFAIAPARGSAQISTTFLKWIGIHSSHLLAAAVLPLALTMTFFAGPLVTLYLDKTLFPAEKSFKEVARETLRDLTWWRNIVVGPVTEEFVYRGCMLPVLASAFGPVGAMIISPVFFGTAHLHSIVQHLHKPKEELQSAITEVCFQLGYTTVFGLYASFLFLRTGHLIAPVLCHAFCNFIGFPDIEYALSHPRRNLILATYAGGLVVFAAALGTVTNPALYHSIFFEKL